jgi:hypothetical protein
MWYYKTRMGTFWILNKSTASAQKKEYVLGFNDNAIQTYHDYHHAMEAVKNQETGCFSWDISNRVFPPQGIKDWIRGQPNDW